MISGIELFYNDKQEYVGFAGPVKVRNQEVLIDTRTGLGYDKVISILGDMITFLAGKFDFESFTREDSKQHVVLRILEGISKFNPNKGTKLSTFLQMRISRLLINEMRDANRFCRNATSLNIKTYSYHCACGHITYANKSDKVDFCDSCQLPIDKSKRHWIRKSTVSLDELSDGYIGQHSRGTDTSKKVAELDLMSCLEDESSETKEIVCLLYFEGQTVKAISEKLGLSLSSVYNKLKSLQRSHKLNELMRSTNVRFG
jgi:RNA polymerase sigma factor (sigma-70 family)